MCISAPASTSSAAAALFSHQKQGSGCKGADRGYILTRQGCAAPACVIAACRDARRCGHGQVQGGGHSLMLVHWPRHQSGVSESAAGQLKADPKQHQTCWLLQSTSPASTSRSDQTCHETAIQTNLPPPHACTRLLLPSFHGCCLQTSACWPSRGRQMVLICCSTRETNMKLPGSCPTAPQWGPASYRWYSHSMSLGSIPAACMMLNCAA